MGTIKIPAFKERELKMLQNNGLSKAALIEGKRPEGSQDDQAKK